MKKLDWLIYPISSTANISTISALSVVTCTFSTTAGYSMLADGLNKKTISQQEVIVTTIISSFPSILSHLFTFFFPVVIPILGLTTGSLYVCIVGLVSIIKSCTGIILAKLWLPKKYQDQNTQLHAPDQADNKAKNNKSALTKSTKSTYRMVKKIVITMFIMLFLVSVAFEMNFFDYFSAVLDPITSSLGLESEVALISATEIVNSYAGIILAGNLQSEGLVSTKGVLIALLLGTVISLSARSVKHSLPLHISLFGPKLGSKTVAINAVMTFIIDVLFIAILLII
ncbi:MAG: hypothetical protein K8R25_18725 [Methanosarcinales archaeon]|nr:hypothetical protein [Methanosarcinales archaeon]